MAVCVTTVSSGGGLMNNENLNVEGRLVAPCSRNFRTGTTSSLSRGDRVEKCGKKSVTFKES